MASGNYSWVAQQFATNVLAWTWLDSSGNAKNLTGWTAAIIFRDPDDTAILSIGTNTGEIVISGSVGVTTVTLSATQSASLAPQGVDANLTWDIRYLSGSGIYYVPLGGTLVMQGGDTNV